MSHEMAMIFTRAGNVIAKRRMPRPALFTNEVEGQEVNFVNRLRAYTAPSAGDLLDHERCLSTTQEPCNPQAIMLIIYADYVHTEADRMLKAASNVSPISVRPACEVVELVPFRLTNRLPIKNARKIENLTSCAGSRHNTPPPQQVVSNIHLRPRLNGLLLKTSCSGSRHNLSPPL